MNSTFWNPERSRRITYRLIIEGDLEFTSPVHFGSGDSAEYVDMPVLSDALENRPLLTGATLAGALRNYIQSVEIGDRKKSSKLSCEKTFKNSEEKLLSEALFGAQRNDDYGEQSAVIVDDAVGTAAGIEKRNGVRINEKTRTAESHALYDYEVWSAGLMFPIRIELIIRACPKD